MGALLFCVGASVASILYEARTSKFQAREISHYAASLNYRLEPGPSDTIIYAGTGPFDLRLGYTRLPQLLDRVQMRGMEINSQIRFSAALMDYTSRGYFIPYPEKAQAGLRIADCRGESIYQSLYPNLVYTSFEEIPPLMVQTLLFIENRKLLDTARVYMNPAVDWARFSRAILLEAGRSVGLDYETIGGSTLATQMEKYRHSPAGITTDPQEKLRQMISASVRAYQDGPETLSARRNLILSYINSVPLSAAPGYGEVHGLGDGLKVWLGEDLVEVNRLLRLPQTKGDTLMAQGLALRQVISLMIAQRRPSWYLGPDGHAKLSELTASYLRLMANNGYISPALRDAGLARKVTFRDFNKTSPVIPIETNKGVLMVRSHLSRLLGAPLYDLERLDLAATTTMQHELQEKVSAYLDQLSEPAFASKAGLLGERLLLASGTDQVRYSFNLFERTPYGNLVRVQTDNTNQPFDINEGSKLEMGSTAKLRVFVTYLEVIAEIHKRYAGKSQQALYNTPQI